MSKPRKYARKPRHISKSIMIIHYSVGNRSLAEFTVKCFNISLSNSNYFTLFYLCVQRNAMLMLPQIRRFAPRLVSVCPCVLLFILLFILLDVCLRVSVPVLVCSLLCLAAFFRLILQLEKTQNVPFYVGIILVATKLRSAFRTIWN